MALTYPEAVVVGLVQGVTELFPASSLGRRFTTRTLTSFAVHCLLAGAGSLVVLAAR